MIMGHDDSMHQLLDPPLYSLTLRTIMKSNHIRKDGLYEEIYL